MLSNRWKIITWANVNLIHWWIFSWTGLIKLKKAKSDIEILQIFDRLGLMKKATDAFPKYKQNVISFWQVFSFACVNVADALALIFAPGINDLTCHLGTCQTCPPQWMIYFCIALACKHAIMCQNWAGISPMLLASGWFQLSSGTLQCVYWFPGILIWNMSYIDGLMQGCTNAICVYNTLDINSLAP